MAKNPKRKKEEILARTIKWELALSPEQEALIIRISDGLREYYNWALETEQSAFDAYTAAVKANPEVKPNGKKHLNEIDLYSRFSPIRARDGDAGLYRATVPANWVLESSLKACTAAYRSFFALVKNGDHDARTPRAHESGWFHTIQGGSAFSVKGDRVVLAPQIFGADTLAFPIPAAYQLKALAHSVRNAKFQITRSERNLQKPAGFFISVTYEIPLPEQVPFVPEEAVYIALGASSIGVVSSKGEEVIPLWRPDKHWKPRTVAIEATLGRNAKAPGHPRALQKGSRKWQKLEAKRRKMFRIMGAQQMQNRREVVSIDLIKKVLSEGVHGVHFVVTDLVVRSKEGKLADASKKGRGGHTGLNWAAQNTGTIAYLVDWLKEKVREHGGSVRKHKLPLTALPSPLPQGDERKILIARALRTDFLSSLAMTEAT